MGRCAVGRTAEFSQSKDQVLKNYALPLTSVLLLGSNFFGTYKVDPFAQEPYKAPYGINAGKASRKYKRESVWI